MVASIWPNISSTLARRGDAKGEREGRELNGTSWRRQWGELWVCRFNDRNIKFKKFFLVLNLSKVEYKK